MDSDLYSDTGKMCLGRGMHCPSSLFFHYHSVQRTKLTAYQFFQHILNISHSIMTDTHLMASFPGQPG